MVAKYHEAVRGYYANLFINQPSVATWFGLQANDADLRDYLNEPALRRNDARLETGSKADYGKTVADYEMSLKTLEALDEKGLGRTERHDLAALIGRIKGDLLYVNGIKLWQKDPGI